MGNLKCPVFGTDFSCGYYFGIPLLGIDENRSYLGLNSRWVVPGFSLSFGFSLDKIRMETRHPTSGPG